MASITHKSVGTLMTQAEYEAADSHILTAWLAQTLTASGTGITMSTSEEPVGANSATFATLQASADYSGTGRCSDNMAAIQAVATVKTSSVNTVEGVNATAASESNDASADAKSLYAVRAAISNTGTGRITHGIALRVLNPTKAAGATTDVAFGAYIGTQTGGGTETSALHIEGSGTGDAITFGNGGSGIYAKIFSESQYVLNVVALSRFTVTSEADYNIVHRMQDTVGGSATTIGLHAVNDALDTWRDLAIDAKDLYLNTASGGKVGIGATSLSYLLHVNTDSAGKPGVGGLWTVISDARIKKNIIPADLDRCYEIVKAVPLKHFAWADGVYSNEQARDRNNLGWIAQDVQPVFPKAVATTRFKKNSQEVIEDCLDLNGGQMLMAMYGALQKTMERVEKLESRR